MRRRPGWWLAGRVGLLAILGSTLLPVHPLHASNDPLFPEQWALAKIQAEPAWAGSRGNGIRVAVVDTGVQFAHEDLAGKGAGSFNCIKDGPIEEPCDPVPDADDNGHGTMVAGVIAATQGNGRGIAPVAPGASIMSFKALAADGSGSLSNVLRGIRSAADNGARIINLSLGPEVSLINDLLNLVLGQDPEEEFRETFRYAAERGALVVAAAGNSGTSSFFAGLDNVYVAGSTGPNDEVAFYSSSGAEIFAPGGNSRSACNPSVCINTTAPNGAYRAVQGTSFAAPHVSGVAALTMAQGLSAAQARARINETADPISEGKRINAVRAVSPAGTAAPPPPPPQPQAAPRPRPRPRPPSAPPQPLPVPVPPPVTDLLPILVLSSEEPPAPAPKPLAAQKPPAPPEGARWPMIMASLLAVSTAVGHAVFGFTRRRNI